MKLVFTLEDLKDRLIRTGLIPEGYEIASIEQSSYSTSIEVELKKREPLNLRVYEAGEGSMPPPFGRQRPCVVDGDIGSLSAPHDAGDVPL